MTTHILVGANRGIGLELTRQLAERGEQVVAVCRQSSAALDALADKPGVSVVTGIDTTDDAAVAGLPAALAGETIGVLWVVAGVLRRSNLSQPDTATCKQLFDVNALGPLRVVSALREQLPQGAKVALLTSRMGSVGDNTSGGSYAYRMSKAALNAAGKSMAMDLKDAGVAVALLHPGWVRTDMTGGNGLVDVDESAAGLVARVDELTLESTGGFWHMNGERLVW
ncbi:MAG: SDR family oxidoreductase [Myxococcales bacterium]|nr:SDR family oxidoreductase [Myxococcales bacterium]